MADIVPPAEELPFILQPIDSVMIVEFRQASLMDPILLERMAQRLYKLVDEEDRRKIILDFESVTFLSSQAIGSILQLHRKLGALNNGKMVLCGVGTRLQELLRITRLDKVLTIKPTQKEALNSFF